MAGIEFRGEVPFSNVYLHGTVRDHRGRKMSKSLGNGIDPLEVVESYGADALRYTLVAGMGVGTDLMLNYEDLESTFAPGRNFANKLWNAGRFALMNLGEGSIPLLDEVSEDLEIVDRWILSRSSRATRRVTESFARFRLNDAAAEAYAFFWGDLADWYLEMIKPRLRGEFGAASQAAARSTLSVVLDRTMRLLHPIVPFITETVWQKLPGREGSAESIMVAAWPEPKPEWEDSDVEAAINELQQIIGATRNIRAEYRVPPSELLTVVIRSQAEPLEERLPGAERILADLGRIDGIRDSKEDREIGASTVLNSGAEIFVPLADVIDLDRERERLRGELERIESQVGSTEKRLANEAFVSKAPADVVEKERAKLSSFAEQREKLEASLSVLEGSA